MTTRFVQSQPVPPDAALAHHKIDDELNRATWLPSGIAAQVETEVRGFALYVGLDEDVASAAGWELVDVVNVLKAELRRLAPTADASAILALSPLGAGGRDLDVVRLALQEPAAVAAMRERRGPEPRRQKAGVLIDLSRNRVTVDGRAVPLTFTEIELLQSLVRWRGQPVRRRELIARLSADHLGGAVPTDRAIDVQIRRLRSKLDPYQDIIGTVRGAGYRFDERGVTTVLNSVTPSPDVF